MDGGMIDWSFTVHRDWLELLSDEEEEETCLHQCPGDWTWDKRLTVKAHYHLAMQHPFARALSWVNYCCIHFNIAPAFWKLLVIMGLTYKVICPIGHCSSHPKIYTVLASTWVQAEFPITPRAMPVSHYWPYSYWQQHLPSCCWQIQIHSMLPILPSCRLIGLFK